MNDQSKVVAIDSLDSLHLAIDGLYERFETDLVKRILKPGMTFVDCGAHIGYYSVLAASLVGPSGRVIAYEPAPENLATLRRNVERFRPLVEIREAALSDIPGWGHLYVSKANSGDHRLFKTQGWDEIPVRVLTLDSDLYLLQRPVDFIKIDVQGLECAVLHGGRETIRQSPNLIGIVEFAPWHLRQAARTSAPNAASELLGILGELGLRSYMRGPKRRLVPATWPALKKLPTHTNLIVSKRPLL